MWFEARTNFLTRNVTQRSDADFDETFFIESTLDMINYSKGIFCGIALLYVLLMKIGTIVKFIKKVIKTQ
jgi:hypothetical protein